MYLTDRFLTMFVNYCILYQYLFTKSICDYRKTNAIINNNHFMNPITSKTFTTNHFEEFINESYNCISYNHVTYNVFSMDSLSGTIIFIDVIINNTNPLVLLILSCFVCLVTCVLSCSSCVGSYVCFGMFALFPIITLSFSLYVWST